MSHKIDARKLVENYRSAKANGDPAKYVHVISVAQAHQTADLILHLQEQVREAREALGYCEGERELAQFTADHCSGCRAMRLKATLSRLTDLDER